VEPISVKWSNEEVNKNHEHQVLWGKTNSNLKVNESKCSNISGELNSLKEKDIHQEGGSENILDIVNRKSPKRPRRQPINRNNDFLWTNITKS
jgi:archaellum component FlaC